MLQGEGEENSKCLLGSYNRIGIEDMGPEVHISNLVSQFHYLLEQTINISKPVSPSEREAHKVLPSEVFEDLMR